MTGRRLKFAALATALTLTTVVSADPPNTSHTSDSQATPPGRILTLLELDRDQSWNRSRSEHYIVQHCSPEDHAQWRVELLEQTWESFHRVFPANEFAVRPVGRRLRCVVFPSRDQFIDYAQRVDRTDMSWSHAYYSARTNRVALFDVPGVAERALAVAAVDAGQAPAEHLLRYVDPAADARGERITLEDVVWASTTHEAAHQLAFNTGLQKRGVMYPLWVSEGLATSFETLEAGEPLDPSQVNPVRQRRLLEAFVLDRLTPLDELIVTTRVPSNDPRALDVLYAQSWGVFHFAYTHEHAALSAYLQALAELPLGARDAETMRAEFEAHFGPSDEYESRWLDWLADSRR